MMRALVVLVLVLMAGRTGPTPVERRGEAL
jgi:hypothetical protein